MKTAVKTKEKKVLKRLVKILIFIVLILVIGFLAFSYYIGKQVAVNLVMQNEGLDTKANSVKQLEEWGYDYKSFQSLYKGKNIILVSEGGNEVSVTFFSIDGNYDRDTVILIHGAGGDHTSMYPIAEFYLENNWNVAAIDQRASGDSKNTLVTFGHFEKNDIVPLVEYIKGKTNNKKIVLHGQSMGAATVGLYVATEHANQNIDYCIMDSSYDSMKGIFLVIWHSMDTGIPDDYVITCGNWYLKRHYAFEFEDVDVVAAQANNMIPTLVIHGTKDDFCFSSMGEEIYNNIAAEKKEIWLVDSGHIEACIDYPDEYAKKVLTFINKY